MAGKSRVVSLSVPQHDTASPPAPSSTPAHVIGRLVGFERVGRVSVEYPGVAGPVDARYLADLQQPGLLAAVERGDSVLLAFEAGDLRKPIVVGLLVDDRIDRPLALVQEADAPTSGVVTPLVEAVALLDGKRVQIHAEDEIVLECGEASITLRRNGRVVIRGTYVETRSRGTNRIKGGTVRIN